MFQLKKPGTLFWPVTIPIPKDGGRTQKVICDIEFHLLDQDDFNEYVHAGDDQSFLRGVMRGWRRVVDEAGEPVEFTDETRDQFINIPYARVALVNAYHEMVAGGARRKN